MAEKPDWVRDFDRPKGTEIKHIRGNWYLYERSWRYDPKIRRSRKVSGRYLRRTVPEGLVPRSRRPQSPTSPGRDADHLENSALFEALGRPSPASVSSPPGNLSRARVRVCSHVRESLATDGRFLPVDGHGALSAPEAPTSPGTPSIPRRASACSPTSHARSRSAATGRRPPTTSTAPAAPPTRRHSHRHRPALLVDFDRPRLVGLI